MDLSYFRNMATGGFDPNESGSSGKRSSLGEDPDFMSVQLALAGLLADDDDDP